MALKLICRKRSGSRKNLNQFSALRGEDFPARKWNKFSIFTTSSLVQSNMKPEPVIRKHLNTNTAWAAGAAYQKASQEYHGAPIGLLFALVVKN